MLLQPLDWRLAKVAEALNLCFQDSLKGSVGEKMQLRVLWILHGRSAT